jgi:hypothetical protein
MTTTHCTANRSRQTGAATLVIAVILLIAVTLAVLFTASTAIMETRMSGNEVRAKQAHAAAQAGIDHAIAFYRVNGVPRDNNGEPNTTPLQPVEPNPTAGGYEVTGEYQVQFCSPDTVLTEACTCAAPPTGLVALIYSCGWSDDRAATQRLSIAVAAPAALPPGGPPDAPLISRGNANLLTGNATIINWYTNTTVWTGGQTTGLSNTSTTLIRDPKNPNAELDGSAPSFGNAQCNNPPTGYICTSRADSFGPDVIGSDITLASLSDDDYFGFFFGFPPDGSDALEYYKSTIQSGNMNPAGGIADVQDGQVYWFDNSQAINQGNLTLGSPENPVVLIIDGNLSIGANVDIYGIVMATGTLEGNGNVNVYGSLIVGSTNMQGSGNVKIIYDPDILLQAAEASGRIGGTLAGTWRDWL